MQSAEPKTGSEADLARECVYRFIALALTSPYEATWPCLLNPDDQHLALEAAALLRDEADFRPEFLSFGELPPEALDLGTLLTELNRPLDHIKAEYDRVFGLVIPKECPPYETEYHPTSQAFQRSQQLADVAGFYRAFGLEPSRANPERPDHITLELEFMAFVLLKKRLAAATDGAGDEASERVLVCEHAERGFLQDHLAWWVPAFATGLLRKAGDGYYHGLARVLAALIPAERQRLKIPAPFKPVQPELIEHPEEDAGCAACARRT
jgi:putative dimethyl sulfoxide reductase chaperone